MGLIFISVLVIYLILTRIKVNSSPLSQVKVVIKASEYEQYEKEIINQMNLESGYLTNTLSQPPIYNPFSMGRVRVRPTTQIDYYSNPNIDDGMDFGVYSDYASATEDFILYLRWIKIPKGLDCKGYNKYIASKGYAMDKNYEKNLNAMC